jgi:ATP/maltotriose-dependent transcriptional regulator MalT
MTWVGEGRPAEAEALLLEAEGGIKDAGLRDDLRAVRATVLHFSGQPAKATALALEILLRPVSEWACVRAAIIAVLCLAAAGRGNEAVDLADRWTEAAHRVPNPFSVMPVGLQRLLLATKCCALVMGGRLHEAEGLATNEYGRYLARHALEGTAMSALLLGWVALARGRVQTAGRWLREAAALSRAPAAPNFLPECLALLAHAAALAGDLPAADAALVQAEEALTPGKQVYKSVLELSRAWVRAAHGEVSDARAIALGVANRAEEAGQYAIAVGALHDVARLGDARAVATRLSPLASDIEAPMGSACAGHVEALAARDGPRLDQASATFEAMGANLLAAEAASQAAAVYRAEGRQASMRASGARARRLLEGCEGARTPALSGLAPDPLTPREREVAMLAAGGRTSAEIAQRLVLSVRTVENHVQRAYAKLGVANRSELGLVL